MKMVSRLFTKGISLLWLMLFLVVPAQAQVGDTEGPTTFTVQLLVLELLVTPPSIDLGVVSAGGSVFSSSESATPTPQIQAFNNSNVNADFQIAGTNAEQSLSDPFNACPCNPSWLLVTTSPTSSDQFRWGFDTGVSPFTYTFLAASPLSTFPTTGPAQTLSLGVSPLGVVTTNWRFDAPAETTYFDEQQFQTLISISPSAP